MSFPQTDEVVANLNSSNNAAIKLLKQYQILCANLEQQASQVHILNSQLISLQEENRLLKSQIENLQNEVKVKQSKIEQFEEHPEVRKAKLTKLRLQETAIKNAIKELEKDDVQPT